MANEHNLIPAKKGEIRNPNGRPKKYVTLLREQGYKLSEINDTIQVMLQMDLVIESSILRKILDMLMHLLRQILMKEQHQNINLLQTIWENLLSSQSKL